MLILHSATDNVYWWTLVNTLQHSPRRKKARNFAVQLLFCQVFSTKFIFFKLLLSDRVWIFQAKKYRYFFGLRSIGDILSPLPASRVLWTWLQFCLKCNYFAAQHLGSYFLLQTRCISVFLSFNICLKQNHILLT